MDSVVTQFLQHSPLEPHWASLLSGEFEKPYFVSLCNRVNAARTNGLVFPPEEDVFSALNFTPPDQIRCVILGQDPYHELGQAHGLAFSVKPGVPLPRSLRNIYKERESDLGIPPVESGCFTPWAEQGVLMINTVLTVNEGQANSHAKFGWQEFTDAVFRAVWQLPQPIAFILWGNQAKKKLEKASDAPTAAPRFLLTSAHPSPLSASRGFFGSRPFSQVNAFLQENGIPPIDWTI